MSGYCPLCSQPIHDGIGHVCVAERIKNTCPSCAALAAERDALREEVANEKRAATEIYKALENARARLALADNCSKLLIEAKAGLDPRYNASLLRDIDAALSAYRKGVRRMDAYEDRNHPGNGFKYHTGKTCIEPGCNSPAGTAWSPYWCFECNVKRIKKIDQQFASLLSPPPKEAPDAR